MEFYIFLNMVWQKMKNGAAHFTIIIENGRVLRNIYTYILDFELDIEKALAGAGS